MQQSDYIRVDKHFVESALSLTKRILSRNGARPTGTSSCLAAAEDLASHFRAYCKNVVKENFSHHPDSLWLMGKIAAISFLLTAIFLNLGGFLYIPACIVSGLSLVYLCIHFFAFGSLFDGLFGKAEGMNVVASIEPKEETKRQILVVSHLDSAHVFTFLSRFKRFAGIRLLLAIAAYLLAAALAILAAVALIISIRLHLETWIRASTLLGAAFLLPLYAFISDKTSPGAGDNMISCTISAQLSLLFSARAEEGKALHHTKLVFLCADGEEIGLRGSSSYVRQHKEELKSVKTSVINLDSLYTLSDLTLMKSDSNGFVRLSKGLAKSLKSLSKELGYDIPIRDIPFGGGGTDAASFAKAGVEAVSIVAMPTSLFCEQNVYHTLDDTPERIEPEVVEAVCNIVANFILQEDEAQ